MLSPKLETSNNQAVGRYTARVLGRCSKQLLYWDTGSGCGTADLRG